MRSFKSLTVQVAVSALWPGYLALLAFAARVGPWPRSLARPAAFGLVVMAWMLLAAALARFLFGPGGWVEEALGAPAPAARQVRRGLWALIAGTFLFLLPAWLLQRGLIASGDRPVTAPELCRALILAFEVLALVVTIRLTRPQGPLMLWIAGEGARGWIARHRRSFRVLAVGYVGTILALDTQGFGFTARRVTTAGFQAVGLVLACLFVYWGIVEAIDHYAWRWVRRGQGRAAASGAASPATGSDPTDGLAVKLRRLAAWCVPIAGLAAGAWIWNFDLALFRSLGEQPIWPNAPAGVTVADALVAVALAAATLAAWRHMGTLFAMAVYPRMTEDPGVRFAVLTLCRYLVLGVGMMASMASLHFGPERIGLGLAALGVGLGFGLQEIVSNFVSGIILLIERPIRVGDVVTVASMSGKVERINIRATTIINADNQSLIVPNREFITANLVNWTHKDRILRVNIPLTVAYGADPDAVSELLLSIARNDPDVLRNPVASASLEGFGDSGMSFTLHVHVPDPSLAGRVKHRVCAEIQKRFREVGFVIPMPTRQVVLTSGPGSGDATPIEWPSGLRADRPSPAPPAPNLPATPCPVCAPAEPSHRGVDE